MAVDDRYKRAAAMQVVQPFQWTTHTDTTSGVDNEERWSSAWIYNGISIGIAAEVPSTKRKMLLGVGQ